MEDGRKVKTVVPKIKIFIKFKVFYNNGDKHDSYNEMYMIT